MASYWGGVDMADEILPRDICPLSIPRDTVVSPPNVPGIPCHPKRPNIQSGLQRNRQDTSARLESRTNTSNAHSGYVWVRCILQATTSSLHACMLNSSSPCRCWSTVERSKYFILKLQIAHRTVEMPCITFIFKHYQYIAGV